MSINMEKKWIKFNLKRRGAAIANMFKIINQSISIAGLEAPWMSLEARLFLFKNNLLRFEL